MRTKVQGMSAKEEFMEKFKKGVRSDIDNNFSIVDLEEVYQWHQSELEKALLEEKSRIRKMIEKDSMVAIDGTWILPISVNAPLKVCTYRYCSD